MEETGNNILEWIHANYFQLTTAEKKVADFVLAQPQQIQFMSITQLADECGAAEATISRFCRTLRLKGFNAFKIELARRSVSVPAQTQPSQDQRTPEGRRAEVVRLATDAVHQTLELTNHALVQQAVDLFEAAPHVMCIGSGGSMVMAQECAHLFSTVTGKFYAVSDSHSQMSATATMGCDDVIVLFSYSGATTNGMEVLRLAKSRNIRTVLITRFAKSPAAKLADVVLCCGSNEGPFQFGSVPARIAQLVVLDLVFQEYRSRNQAACEDNIRRIAAALSEKHL